MRLSYPHKHITSEGFHIKTPVMWVRLSSRQSCYLFHDISHPNICLWYGMSVVGVTELRRSTDNGATSVELKKMGMKQAHEDKDEGDKME